MPTVLIASGVAFFLSCLGMPWIEKIGRVRGFTTTPAAHKIDQRRLPYLGGVALFFVVWGGLSAGLGIDRGHHIPASTLSFFLLAAGWTAVFGLYDDMRELSPVYKFAAQIVSALIIVHAGIHTNMFFLSPLANKTLSVLWIVVLMNAINLMDIMDGLAGGITLINSLFFFLFGWLSQNVFVMLVSAVLAAGLLPFLRRNLPPARLVMGDAGSQLLGMCQAAMAMSLNLAAAGHELRLLIPVLILALPLFDLLFVVSMRARQGRAIFLKSNDHFVFRMRQAGISEGMILGRMTASGLATNAVAVLVFFVPPVWGAVFCFVCLGALLRAGARVGSVQVKR